MLVAQHALERASLLGAENTLKTEMTMASTALDYVFSNSELEWISN